MHIAHFTNTYYPVISGVVRSVSAYRLALSDLGHNVFVFAQDAGNYKDEEPFIFRYPSLNITWPADFPVTVPISPHIDQLIPTLKLDVVHTHHPVLIGWAAAQKAADLNLPLVFTFHTQYREYSHYIPLPQETVQEFIRHTIDNWLAEFIRRCQHVIVPSKSMLDILLEVYGVEDHYTVLPTGLDLHAYQNAGVYPLRQQQGWQNERILISAGRLAKEKNWQTLIKAVALVVKDHPDLRLVLVGDGPEREALSRLVRELEIQPYVFFAGSVPFEDVPRYLKAADLFLFSSVTETQGLVTLEALACDLPVIAVEASGTRDIIVDGREGLLTPNDSQALAQAIHRMLSDAGLYQRCKQAAKKRAQEFEIHNLAVRLVEVYRQAIAAKKANQTVSVASQIDRKSTVGLADL